MVYLVIYVVWPPSCTTPLPGEAKCLDDLVHEEAHPVVSNPRKPFLNAFRLDTSTVH